MSPEFRKQFIDNFQRTSLNTTPGDAMMLRILVESARAKRGVEVGTASGFGAINMGIAFERTGGHLWTLDINPKAVKETQENLKKVGLENVVTCVEGDALKTLPGHRGPDRLRLHRRPQAGLFQVPQDPRAQALRRRGGRRRQRDRSRPGP